MTETPWTPGPWCALPNQPGELTLKRPFWEIGQADTPNRGVAFAFGADDANARLIAAAPEMAELLDGFVDYMSATTDECTEADCVCLHCMAAALLARVRGEEIQG